MVFWMREWQRLALYLGIECVAGFAFAIIFNSSFLKDHDVWWLLATGRWIWQHRSLPATDPFSYTFALQPGRIYALHQWLSEIGFYSVYKIDGFKSLLSIVAMLLFTAFFALPLRSLRKAAPLWLALPPVLCGVWATAFHFRARPETFSYLFLAVLLSLFTARRIRRESAFAERQLSAEPAAEMVAHAVPPPGKQSIWQAARAAVARIDARAEAWFVLAILVIIGMWCNFHSAFVFAVVYLFAYSAGTIAAAIDAHDPECIDFTALLMTFVAPLAGLCNPYGAGLFLYLQRQLYFDPVMDTIRELKPINFASTSHQPFLLFIAITVGLLFYLQQKGPSNRAKTSPFWWTNGIIALMFVMFAFQHARVIQLAVLVILFELAIICSRQLARSLDPIECKPLLMPIAIVIPCFCCVLGVYSSFYLLGEKPQWQTEEMIRMEKVIQYISDHCAGRHIFNDERYGDMMIWLSPQKPPVFIDTRYDLYGGPLVGEMDLVNYGSPGWSEVMSKYNIDMVFCPASMPIARLLERTPGWRVIYSDRNINCVVIERK